MTDVARNEFADLAGRINKFPQGAPATELLFRILSLLFSPREAHLVSRLPLRPFSAAKAAGIWRVSEREARTILEELASRALLIDIEHPQGTRYFLPPPMAGFFEFSLMRVRPDIDQRELARLFYRYINVEEEFARELFATGETRVGRVFVNEAALPAELTTVILDYERASEVIRSASHIAVGLCYCRNKMAQVGMGCRAPRDNCLTLNRVARSLIHNGSARRVEVAQGLDLLQEAREQNLVQCGDNVQHEVNFICNCCGCCCEAMLALRRLAIPSRQYSTNFLTRLDQDRCNGCGRCVAVCPIEALVFSAPESGPAERGWTDGGGTQGGNGSEGGCDHAVGGSKGGEAETGRGVGSSGKGIVVPAPDGHHLGPGRPWPSRSAAEDCGAATVRRRVELQQEVCLGCGVCVANCRTGALRLEARPQRVITPVNAAHRLVLMAIERGKLQNLIFDNQAYLSHRVMAAILGAILQLPPVKRLMASRQLKSRFLERIMKDVDITDHTR